MRGKTVGFRYLLGLTLICVFEIVYPGLTRRGIHQLYIQNGRVDWTPVAQLEDPYQKGRLSTSICATIPLPARPDPAYYDQEHTPAILDEYMLFDMTFRL